MIAEINEFLVFGEMLGAMGQTGHHQIDCSSNGKWAIADSDSSTVAVAIIIFADRNSPPLQKTASELWWLSGG